MNKSFSLIAVMLIVTLGIAGCTTPATTVRRHDVTGLSNSEVVNVKDLRPESEKQRATFSLLVTSNAYGIYRNGDLNFDPTPLRLFQHRVYEQFASTSSPITLIRALLPSPAKLNRKSDFEEAIKAYLSVL